MKELAARRPFLLVLLISLVWLLVAVPITSVTALVAPNTTELQQRLLGLIGLTALTFTLLTWLGWWRNVGFNRMSKWRDLQLLVLPAAVLCWPLFYGIQPIGRGELALLLIG